MAIPDGDPSSATVALSVEADSLRDRQPRLSEDDRREVEAGGGPDVLDAQHHPRIEFRSKRLEIEPGDSPGHVRGKLHGTLTLRGRSIPTDVALDAERTGDSGASAATRG